MSPAQANEKLAAGARFILLELDSGWRHLLAADGSGARKHKGLGVLDPGRFVGHPFGSRHRVADKEVALLAPTAPDLVATLARKAQIITPKDTSRIVWELGLSPGGRVLESGVGSGGLTVPLAHAVGPMGKVVVQELRSEFAEWAMDNLRRAGLATQVEIHLGDLTQAAHAGVVSGGPYQAAALDQPEPWLAIPHLEPLLAPGATLACYTPQVSQMEATVRRLQGSAHAFPAAPAGPAGHAGPASGWADIRAFELIERAWEVKERGSRPSFDGLGHTGFLVFARWIGAPQAGGTPHAGPPAPATPR